MNTPPNWAVAPDVNARTKCRNLLEYSVRVHAGEPRTLAALVKRRDG